MIPAIKIENLSKQYRLGLVGTGTLSHDLKRWWHLIRGQVEKIICDLRNAISDLLRKTIKMLESSLAHLFQSETELASSAKPILNRQSAIAYQGDLLRQLTITLESNQKEHLFFC